MAIHGATIRASSPSLFEQADFVEEPRAGAGLRLGALGVIGVLILLLGLWGPGLEEGLAHASQAPSWKEGALKVRVAGRSGAELRGATVRVWPAAARGARPALIALCDAEGRASFCRKNLPAAFVITAHLEDRGVESPLLTPSSVVDPALVLALPD